MKRLYPLFKILNFLIFLIYISIIILCFTWSPFIICVILIRQRLMLFIILSNLLSSWIGIIFVFIFAGGIIIVFAYMVSLSRNEKVTLKIPTLILIVLVLIIRITRNQEISFFNQSLLLDAFSLYYHLSMPLIVLFCIFLLIVLFACVFITRAFHGILKKTY